MATSDLQQTTAFAFDHMTAPPTFRALALADETTGEAESFEVRATVVAETTETIDTLAGREE